VPKKVCTSCVINKALDAFGPYAGRSKDGRRAICRNCQRQKDKGYPCYSKERRKETRAKRRDKAKVYATKHIEQNRAAYVIERCRRRARKKGWAFDLDQHAEALQRRFDAGRCELTGALLRQTHGPLAWDSPSLDRIDSSSGYVYANVRVVCHLANAALGSWGETRLRTVMTAWLR